MDTSIEIKTIVQARFHLERGEMLYFRLQDGDGFVRQEEEDKLHLIVQPNRGAAYEYSGTYEALEAMLEVGNLYFYVIKGMRLEKRKAGLLDKLTDKFRKRGKEINEK